MEYTAKLRMALEMRVKCHKLIYSNYIINLLSIEIRFSYN